MLLRNKITGKVKTCDMVVITDEKHIVGELASFNRHTLIFGSIERLNDKYEDYVPVEPIFDEKIRKGIRAWWDMQDNPFKAAAVLCDGRKDLDGFYHWRIFGYIRDGEQKESTDLCFRTKKLYDYNSSHDYTREELCGEVE